MEEQLASELTGLQMFLRIVIILTATIVLAKILNIAYKRFIERRALKGL
jgi:hypothetical protein